VEDEDVSGLLLLLLSLALALALALASALSRPMLPVTPITSASSSLLISRLLKWLSPSRSC